MLRCYEVHFKNGERLMDVGIDEQDVWDYAESLSRKKPSHQSSSIRKLEGA